MMRELALPYNVRNWSGLVSSEGIMASGPQMPQQQILCRLAEGDFTPCCRFKPGGHDMLETSTSTFLIGSVVFDRDSTLVVAIELSAKSWVLAAHVPGLPLTKAN